ncbi:MAG TPA: type II secretion system protein [Kiritimatiellia bacterium]|mgnify:CR=1 FL=1|nr:type II secretion system protein [Kiritimatiellia bacterium]HPS06347.1 type II secretion system protein [Kiritimatiellia bacterium]
MLNRTNRKQAAFTLIEMMVVVAVIGILIGVTFRLMGTVGEKKKEAETMARMQRLQNALSGFYAEYGTYPPVKRHCSPDPYREPDDTEYGQDLWKDEDAVTEITWENAHHAASSQPIGFGRPNVGSLDAYINQVYQSQGLMSPNALSGNLTGADFRTERRIFKFGVLSYLLPRIELLGGEQKLLEMNDPPNKDMFKTDQWAANNQGKWKGISDDQMKAQLRAIHERELRTVSHWLPNFENSLVGVQGQLWGLNLAAPLQDGFNFVKTKDPQSGNRYVLTTVTIRDGWGREFYYYSAPPYQSYRIWSAGADGKTFPPWAKPQDRDREEVNGWTKDDLVLFDR